MVSLVFVVSTDIKLLAQFELYSFAPNSKIPVFQNIACLQSLRVHGISVILSLLGRKLRVEGLQKDCLAFWGDCFWLSRVIALRIL